ncbi:hypothetical protein GW915_00135 [bacterium]|nr:hypothetical protein [bacterium]
MKTQNTEIKKVPTRLMFLLSVLSFLVSFFVSHSIFAQTSINEHAQSAMSGNGGQTAAASGDLASNSAACNPKNIAPCLKIPLDIASIIGALQSLMANSGSNQTVDTSGIDSLGKIPDFKPTAYNTPDYKPLVNDVKNVCKIAPTLCDDSKCIEGTHNPSCLRLKVPDAFASNAEKLKNDYKDGLLDKDLFPEEFLEEANFLKALDAIDGVPEGIQSINKSLAEAALDKDSKVNENLSLNEHHSDDSDGSQPVKLGQLDLPDLNDLLKKYKQNQGALPQVFIKNLDLEDASTGKRLTLFERATRRHQGTQEFPRGFVLARMEKMRSVAIAKQEKVEKFIAQKKAQILATLDSSAIGSRK